MYVHALVLLYALFFLSGAAALIYQVVWVRALVLVFGGSHLAVTVVLTVFMAGLAAGGALFGRLADSTERLLRLYVLLEIGIAVRAGNAVPSTGPFLRTSRRIIENKIRDAHAMREGTN